jgi:O-antigen ligase
LWFAGLVVLAPALTQPLIAIGLVLAVAAFALAWKSIAWPLGLSGVPALLAAVLGSNPLPKGGTTLLLAAWVALAVALAVMRRGEAVALGALTTLPVAMAFLLLALMLIRFGPSAQAWGSTKLQLYVANNLMFLVGAVFVGANAERRKLFLYVTLAVFSVGALYLLLQLVTGNAQMQFSGRFSISAQEGPIYLGRDSATGVMIATFLILVAKTRRVRLLAGSALPVLLISLIAAGSRGPTVAFAVGFVAMLALIAASGRARRRLGVIVGLLLLAAVLVPLLVPGSAIGRSLSTIVGSASGLSSNGRSTLWSEAYTAFSQHTVFGIGTGGFAAIDPVLEYPHNILLEVAVELGIIGLLALVTMIVSMMRRVSYVWRKTFGYERLEASLIIGLLLMAIVNACFSGAIQDNRDVWIWGGIGIGVYARLRAAPAPGGVSARFVPE